MQTKLPNRVPPRPKGRTCQVLVRKVNRHVHDQFKAACSRRGISMQEALKALMMNYILEDSRLLGEGTP